jgi:hypothetical protein
MPTNWLQMPKYLPAPPQPKNEKNKINLTVYKKNFSLGRLHFISAES